MNLRFLRIAILLMVLVAIAAATAGFKFAAALGEANLASAQLQQEKTLVTIERARAQRELAWRRMITTRFLNLQKTLLALMEREQSLAVDRAKLRKEIAAYVAQNEDADRACSGLDAEWLRTYNAAFDLSRAAPAGDLHASGDSAHAPTPGASGSGLQQGPTPADILTHAEEVGAWCLTLETRLRAVVAPSGNTTKAVP